MVAKKTHYEVLEISKDAKLIDIKKAYRRLALKHHPDRNNGSAESTEKFKDISQAYSILSDKTTRSYYDATVHSANSPAPSTSTATTTTASTSTGGPTSVSPPQQRVPTSPTTRGGVRDAFKQFDDLFRNDPFFNEAFQDMDGAFSHRFDNSQDQNCDDFTTNDRMDGEPCGEGVGPLLFCGMEPPKMKKKSAAARKRVPWSQWLMNKLGVEVSVSSVSHKADGSVEASHYTSKPIGTYTNKKSRTYVEGGQQVTIMSMEKDGNTIEDKLIAGQLVERRVNGRIEQNPKQVGN